MGTFVGTFGRICCTFPGVVLAYHYTESGTVPREVVVASLGSLLTLMGTYVLALVAFGQKLKSAMGLARTKQVSNLSRT